MRVELELWFGSGRELGESFQILSPVRSRTRVEVSEGTTLGELLRAVADRNPGLQELLFDSKGSVLKENLVLLKNGRLAARSVLLGESLNQKDDIRVLPLYAGG